MSSSEDIPFKYAESVEDFYKIMTNNKVIVIYSAGWCTPCKELKDKLLKKKFKKYPYPILIVDVDNMALEDLVGNVNGMPTIEFIENKEVVKKVEGYNEEFMTECLNNWKDGLPLPKKQ